MSAKCALCDREVDTLSKHHLVPRCRLSNRNRKERKKLRSQETPNLAYICGPCHDHTHTVFTEKELDREYNNPEKIKEHPDIIKFLKWIKNKPPDFRLNVRR